LRRLYRDGRAEGIDLLGASFGATPDLMRFWDHCGFRPAQIGTSRNAASGEHALVVLRRLNVRGWRFAKEAEARLESRLPILLAGPLRTLDPTTAAALVETLGFMPSAERLEQVCANDIEDRELNGFIEGHRSLDATLPLLADLTRRRLGARLRAQQVAIGDAALLIAATRQLRSVAELTSCFGAAGRDEILSRIRRASKALRRESDSVERP
jgi:tRNA(Met) cytidine acetyltransferase